MSAGMRLFGMKDDAVASEVGEQKRKMETTQRERMIILAVITVVLVIAGSVALIATSAGTPLSRCTRIVVSQQKSACLLELANSTMNVSVCNYLSGTLASQCVSGIALASSNTTACSNLSSNESSYSQCIIAIGTSDGNASYCSALSEPYISTCAYSVAEHNSFNDTVTCTMIGNASLMNDCMLKSYYNEAVSLKNATYCSYLPNSANATLVSYMSQSSTSLFGISNATATLPYLNSTTPQQFCYYNVALIAHNLSTCSMVSGQLNMLCTARLTSATSYNTSLTNATANSITLDNVSQLCSSVPSSVQSLCIYSLYSYIAVQSRNASVCNLISSPLYQGACYAGLAQRYNDSSYCDYIQNVSIRSACATAPQSNTST